MSGRAVAVYDLSGRAGWAVYAPDMDQPEHGVLRMPPATVEGSAGPAFKLLFDHVAWINRRWPLATIGYEQFIAPTGGKKDEDKDFVTSPKTTLQQVGKVAIVQCCATMLRIESHAINNASWRRYWLGSQKRGTKREEWKDMSVAKAAALGWSPKSDDDADALGQLHFLLNKLGIKPDWWRYDPTPALIQLGYQRGIPVHV